MFDSKTSLTHRVADGVDLLIDFATLGEYGLEPTGPNPRARHTCQGDRRTVPTPRKLRERGPQIPARSKILQRHDRTQPTHRTRTRTPIAGSSDLWSQMTTRPRRTSE